MLVVVPPAHTNILLAIATPGFPRNPSLAPLPLLFTACSALQCCALPPVKWMFDFYCAVLGGQRKLGNKPNQ